MKTSTITRRSRCLSVTWTIGELQDDGTVAFAVDDLAPRCHGTPRQIVGWMDRAVAAIGVCLVRFRLFVGRREVTQEDWQYKLHALSTLKVVDRITLETED